MKKIALQISPEVKSAYFANYIDVARQELVQVAGDIPVRYSKVGPLEYFELQGEDLNLDELMYLSFTQGVYAIEGELMRPLNLCAEYRLHEDFVFGSKFKGKTNERLTQMLINVGLAAIGEKSTDGIKLLDPMCGRATTLLWAMRYGIDARGIEQDSKAIVDIHRNLKKWTKLHRQKHKLSEGMLGGGKKKGAGQYLDFVAEDCSMRVVIGDSRHADQVYKKEKFDLIVSDLPYGVQHFTTEKSRNPLTVIEQSIESWKHCMKNKGAIVLSYNSNNPRRDALIKVINNAGLVVMPFSVKHRMSESIVRDVVIIKSSG